jgi:hypothetical protein
VAAKSSVAVSLDLDRLVREEATEWFTSNRKDLESVMRRVADRVREEVEAIWREENTRLRERVSSLEQIVNVVRTQVVDEDQRRA